MSKLYTAGTMKTDNLLIKNGDKQVVRITGGNSPRRKTDSRPRTLIVYGFLLPFGRYKFDNLLSSCVRLSVCPDLLSQASFVSKQRDESSWFFASMLLPPIPHCVIRKFG